MARSSAETTTYADYFDGKPGQITEPDGTKVTNTYDESGNLLSSSTTDPITLVTTQTSSNSYTPAGNGVAAGLAIETLALGFSGNLVPETTNVYYGSNVGSGSPNYLVSRHSRGM